MNSLLKNQMQVLLIVVFTLVILFVGIIKIPWVRWLYVFISFPFLCYLVVWWILQIKEKKKVDLYARELEDLRLYTDELEKNKNTLLESSVAQERLIVDKEYEIEHLKRQCDIILKESTLSNKYQNILIFFQDLDRFIDDLPDEDNGFKTAIHKRITETLSLFGYKIEDFEQESKLMYEIVAGSIDTPEVVVRAITTLDGSLVLKGKVFIPYEEDNK